MQPFWQIVTSNALLVVVLAAGVALLGRLWKNPYGLHLLWLLVLLKLVTPPLVTVPLPLIEQRGGSQAVTTPSAVETSEQKAVSSTASGADHASLPDSRPLLENASDRQAGRFQNSPRPLAGEGPGVRAASTTTDSDAISAAQLASIPWRTILGSIWGLGIVLFASRQAYRIVRFQRLLRSSTEPASALLDMAARVAKQLGLKRIPQVRLLPVCVSPLVWSLGARPQVFLPAALFSRLGAEAQEAILAHELAHVLRRDHWVRLVEMAATVLFWWHSVVWWAARQLQELEDQCCDALVANLTPHAVKTYATALVDTLDFLSERSIPAPVGATAAKSSSSLARRINMLKNRSWTARLTFGHVLFLLAVAAIPMTLAFGQKPPEAAKQAPAIQPRALPSASRPQPPSPAAEKTPAVRVDITVMKMPSYLDLVQRLPGGVVLSEAEARMLLANHKADVLTAPSLVCPVGREVGCEVSPQGSRRRLRCLFLPDADAAKGMISLRIKPDAMPPQPAGEKASAAPPSSEKWPSSKEWQTSIDAKLRQGEAIVFGGWDGAAPDMRSDHNVIVFVAQASLMESAKPSEQPGVQRRAVNKRVKDFPEKTDLSTPESAQAAWNRATAKKDAQAVVQLSWTPLDPKAEEQWFARQQSRDPRGLAVYLKAVAESEILEVLTSREDLALVVSVLPFAPGQGRDPYSARYFGRIDGQWKNLGEDRWATVETAREAFGRTKENLWKNYVQVRDSIKSGKPLASRSERPKRSAPIAPGGPLGISVEKADLMGRVEWAMMHGARDITARKTIEWGDVEKDKDGNRRIRYKFYATIWDKDVYVMNMVFTFDAKGNILDTEDVAGFPQKKVEKLADVNTQEGMKALVEDFFTKNFRDVTSRETIEWGEVTKAANGQSSIRYQYRAKIWDKETKIMNQVFTFDAKGEFVSVKNVDGFPRNP